MSSIFLKQLSIDVNKLSTCSDGENRILRGHIAHYLYIRHVVCA